MAVLWKNSPRWLSRLKGAHVALEAAFPSKGPLPFECVLSLLSCARVHVRRHVLSVSSSVKLDLLICIFSIIFIKNTMFGGDLSW